MGSHGMPRICVHNLPGFVRRHRWPARLPRVDCCFRLPPGRCVESCEFQNDKLIQFSLSLFLFLCVCSCDRAKQLARMFLCLFVFSELWRSEKTGKKETFRRGERITAWSQSDWKIRNMERGEVSGINQGKTTGWKRIELVWKPWVNCSLRWILVAAYTQFEKLFTYSFCANATFRTFKVVFN